MVMFSATWPLAVHQLAQEFMDPNPVKVCPYSFLFRPSIVYIYHLYDKLLVIGCCGIRGSGS